MLLRMLFIAVPFLTGAMQTPARPIAAYWKAVSAARSVADAHAVPKPANSAKLRDGDIAEGLLKLREYELTFDKTAAFMATRTLEKVVDRTPNDPWAHYALGATLARGPDVRVRTFAERTAYSVFSKGSLAALNAPRRLADALRLDPSFELAAIEYATLAIDYNERELMDSAAARLSSSRMKGSAAAMLVQSELARRLGAGIAANQFAERAEAAGYDASLTSYQRASSLFRAKQEAKGAGAYFDGVSELTTEGSDLYFASLELTITPEEAAEWKKLSVAERRSWLRNFWEMRAALAGVTVEKRLAEHFRRLSLLEPYRQVKTSPTPTAQDVRKGFHPSLKTELPHIYSIMKHGRADMQQMYMYCEPGWDTLPVPMQPSLASCRTSPYGRAQAGSFRHGECPSFPIGTSRKASIDPDAPAASPAQWHTNDSLVSQYFKCKSAGGSMDMGDAMALRGNRYRAGKKAVRGETFYPPYIPVVIAWEALQFRGPGTGAEVVAAVGIAHESVETLTDNTGHFDATMNLVLVDTVSDWIMRAKAPLRVPASSVERVSYVLLHAKTPAPSAPDVALRIRVEGVDGKAGAIAYGNIDIERFPDDSLTMSDIVLSPQGGTGAFERGDVKLTLAPGRSFRSTETPTVYYEVYNATPNASITTEIRIDPVREGVSRIIDKVVGADHAVFVRFEDATAQPLPQFGFQLKREIDLQSLAPGDYHMTITVTDTKTGRTTTRGRLLVVTAE